MKSYRAALLALAAVSSTLPAGQVHAEPAVVAALAVLTFGVGAVAGSSHHRTHHHGHGGHGGHAHHGHSHSHVSQETWNYIAQQAARPSSDGCALSGIVPDPKRCRSALSRVSVAEPIGYEVMSMDDWRAWELYGKWTSEGHPESADIWRLSKETPKFDPLTGHVRMWNGYLKKWFY